MYDVITIGAATTDVFVRSPQLDIRPGKGPRPGTEACFPLGAKLEIDELDIQTGGGATNTAATFASLGFRTATVASIGKDDNGSLLLKELGRFGIDISLVQTAPRARTGYSIIILAGSGERTILVHRGASKRIDAVRIPWRKLRTRWFYVSSLGGDIALMRRVLSHAKRTGAKVAWNPGGAELKRGIRSLGPLIAACDIVLMNKEEASTLVGVSKPDVMAASSRFTRSPKIALVITDGRKGSVAFTEDADIWSGLPKGPAPVNTTGAGDAFGSGMVASLLRGDDIASALVVGTWNATGVVSVTGAKRGIISRFPGPEKMRKVPIRLWK